MASRRRGVRWVDLAVHADAQVLALDVTSDDSVAAAAQEVGKFTDGRLNLLINNVRIHRFLGEDADLL